MLDARNNPATVGVGHIIDATLVELESDHPGRSAALCDLARLLLVHLLRGLFVKASTVGYLTALGDPQTAVHCCSFTHATEKTGRLRAWPRRPG